MTLKTVEEKVDDAVYAAFNALGLSVTDNIDASVAMNEAITPIAEKLITDDTEDEAADPDDPCPECGKQLESGPGGGVVCPDKTDCGYWFCY